MAVSIRADLALLCLNVWTSYRHKVPGVILKDSLEQSQSGFQSMPGAKERFLNREAIKILKINNISQPG
jgi:hypothetical protein